MKKNLSIITTVALLAIISISSCKKDKEESNRADDLNKELHGKAANNSGAAWYKNSQAKLDKAPASGHSDPKLRTWYNSAAAIMLDTAGQVISGSIFTNGSLIVKELFDASENLTHYAVMYKSSSSEFADAHGWVWGEYSPSGSVEYSVDRKGASCTGCHSGVSGNIDLTTMHVAHP